MLAQKFLSKAISDKLKTGLPELIPSQQAAIRALLTLYYICRLCNDFFLKDSQSDENLV